MSLYPGHLYIVPLYKDMSLYDEHVFQKKPSVRTIRTPSFLVIFIHEIILCELKRALIDDLSSRIQKSIFEKKLMDSPLTFFEICFYSLR